MKTPLLVIFAVLASFLIVSCEKKELNDDTQETPSVPKPMRVDSLTIQVRNKSGEAIKDAYVVLFQSQGIFDKRIGESATDDKGEYKLWRYGSFTGYCTVVAADYEPVVVEFDQEQIDNTVKIVELEPKSTWSIMCYNILQAFQGDVATDKENGMTDAQIAERTRARRASFAKWIKTYDPDLIFFQELNGLKGSGAMTAFVKEFGYDYGTVLGASGYPMGIATKTPHTLIQKYGYDVTFNGKKYNLHHGAGHTLWENIRLFGIHFCPFWEAYTPEKRCHDATLEAEFVMEIIKARSEESDWIVAGDFNSCSEFDRLTNSESWTYRSKNMGVTNLFLKNGFKDAFASFGRPELSVKRYKASVGIPYLLKNIQDKTNRIDYIFLSPSLASKCTYADVVQTQFTDTVSDHYPVYIRLKK